MKLLQKFASSPSRDLAKAPVSFQDELATLLGKDSMITKTHKESVLSGIPEGHIELSDFTQQILCKQCENFG